MLLKRWDKPARTNLPPTEKLGRSSQSIAMYCLLSLKSCSPRNPEPSCIPPISWKMYCKSHSVRGAARQHNVPALCCASEWLLVVEWYCVLHFVDLPKLVCECLCVSMSAMLARAPVMFVKGLYRLMDLDRIERDRDAL